MTSDFGHLDMDPGPVWFMPVMYLNCRMPKLILIYICCDIFSFVKLSDVSILFSCVKLSGVPMLQITGSAL